VPDSHTVSLYHLHMCTVFLSYDLRSDVAQYVQLLL